jgi:homocysteine S-methyltransferase
MRIYGRATRKRRQKRSYSTDAGYEGLCSVNASLLFNTLRVTHMLSRYRERLPQLGPRRFLTDGGLETTLIFHERFQLPLFAAFDLLRDAVGTEALYRYYARYALFARAQRIGFLLEAPTWRANPDWARKLAYSRAGLAEVNRRSIELLVRIRDEFEAAESPLVISGVIGPRGDGYRADKRMSVAEAELYHAEQIGTFRETEADMIGAYTMNYVDEAIGIVRAARAARMPVAISFTLETDGRLPSGDALSDAITRTDSATDAYPAYYMINCAHPTHFEHVLRDEGVWRLRLRGLRTNASRRSHIELDASLELDEGNPAELGEQHRGLLALLPQLAVVGGCCGTDLRHVEAICRAIHPAAAA